MKTTDLIPLILYQLVDGDKYGYEIVKQIEDASGGVISIKQPTLYSVLKKLEHGKFISSYWQDSEIGGKRHYYKLTPNGKAQLDTYPSFDKLLNEAMTEEGSSSTMPAIALDNEISESENHPTSSPTKELSDNFARFEQSSNLNPIIADKVDTFDFYTPVNTEDTAPSKLEELPFEKIKEQDLDFNQNADFGLNLTPETEIVDPIFNQNIDENLIAEQEYSADPNDFSFEQSENIDNPALNEQDLNCDTFQQPIDLESDISQDMDEPIIEPIDLTSPFKPIDLTTSFSVEEDSYNSFNQEDNTFTEIKPSEDLLPPLPFEIGTESKVKSEDFDEEIEKQDLQNESITAHQDTYVNIFDAIEYDNEATPTNQSQDEQNLQPTASLDNLSNAENEVEPSSKFTDKVKPMTEPIVNNKLYDKLTPNQDLFKNSVASQQETPIKDIEQVKYLNYVDFTTEPTSIKRKNAVTKHIQKMSLTCLSLLIMFVSSIFIGKKYSFSKIYYICAIVVCLVLVLYPILSLKNASKTRLKYCSQPFKYSISRDFFIKLSLFLSLVIVVFAYNLSLVTQVSDIFALSNFSNFLAPIMLGFVIILDFAYSVMLFKSYK